MAKESPFTRRAAEQGRRLLGNGNRTQKTLPLAITFEKKPQLPVVLSNQPLLVFLT